MYIQKMGSSESKESTLKSDGNINNDLILENENPADSLVDANCT